eukprot:g32038.t1
MPVTHPPFSAKDCNFPCERSEKGGLLMALFIKSTGQLGVQKLGGFLRAEMQPDAPSSSRLADDFVHLFPLSKAMPRAAPVDRRGPVDSHSGVSHGTAHARTRSSASDDGDLCLCSLALARLPAVPPGAARAWRTAAAEQGAAALRTPGAGWDGGTWDEAGELTRCSAVLTFDRHRLPQYLLLLNEGRLTLHWGAAELLEVQMNDHLGHDLPGRPTWIGDAVAHRFTLRTEDGKSYRCMAPLEPQSPRLAGLMSAVSALSSKALAEALASDVQVWCVADGAGRRSPEDEDDEETRGPESRRGRRAGTVLFGTWSA